MFKGDRVRYEEERREREWDISRGRKRAREREREREGIMRAKRIFISPPTTSPHLFLKHKEGKSLNFAKR